MYIYIYRERERVSAYSKKVHSFLPRTPRGPMLA